MAWRKAQAQLAQKSLKLALPEDDVRGAIEGPAVQPTPKAAKDLADLGYGQIAGELLPDVLGELQDCFALRLPGRGPQDASQQRTRRIRDVVSGFAFGGKVVHLNGTSVMTAHLFDLGGDAVSSRLQYEAELWLDIAVRMKGGCQADAQAGNRVSRHKPHMAEGGRNRWVGSLVLQFLQMEIGFDPEGLGRQGVLRIAARHVEIRALDAAQSGVAEHAAKPLQDCRLASSVGSDEIGQVSEPYFAGLGTKRLEVADSQRGELHDRRFLRGN